MAKNIFHSGSQRTRVNGIELVYETFGDPQAPLLVLIAGMGNQMIGWRKTFCDLLAARGYRVVRFDNRDSGLSTRLRDGGKPNMLALLWQYLWGKPVQAPYTLLDMADDTVGLMDLLNCESAHIVGSSMGGMVAQAMAVHFPDRVRSLTSMMSTVYDPRVAPPKPRALIMFKASPKDRAGYIEHAVRVRRALRGGGFPLNEQEIRAYAARLYDRNHDSSGVPRQWAAVMASIRMVRERVKSIRIPTLIIHGDRDPLIPVRHGIRNAQAIPGAELEIIEGLGHEFPPGVWSQMIEAIALHARKDAE